MVTHHARRRARALAALIGATSTIIYVFVLDLFLSGDLFPLPSHPWLKPVVAFTYVVPLAIAIGPISGALNVYVLHPSTTP